MFFNGMSFFIALITIVLSIRIIKPQNVYMIKAKKRERATRNGSKFQMQNIEFFEFDGNVHYSKMKRDPI